MSRLILIWSVLACLAGPPALAQEKNDLDDYEEALRNGPASGNAQETQEELVDVSDARQYSKLSGLERRIAALERENRFQEERIRQLDRSLEDLKRRR